MQLVDDWIFVTVYVNNTGPYTFILDTGASSAVVSPRISQQFPESVFGITTTSAGPGTPSIESPLFRIDTLDMGDIRFELVRATVIDLDEPFRNVGFVVDGVVGLPLFEPVALTLDYPGRKIRVQTGVLPAADNCGIFPVQKTDTNLLMMWISVAGRSEQALIDTGNNAFLHLPSSYDDLDFTAPTTTGSTTTVVGGSEVILGCLASGSVGFGCISYDDPCVAVGGEFANLGAEAMMPYVVTIDQTSGLVRFQ